ncbi:MAG: acetylxylan esterase [Methylococcales bacterium]|nr:acetylxylan esterase [Methylococcales bacterium]
MSDDNSRVLDAVNYNFDPTYGYTLKQLLAVPTPKEPQGFDAFWLARYQHALAVDAAPQLTLLHENQHGWRVFAIRYTSTDNFPIRGWLLVPVSGVVKRGFIIGHGYGGRDGPDFHLPFHDAALLFPCFRGLGLSARPPISSEPNWHVLHYINDKNRYVLGGCVEDVWLATTAMLGLFPETAGRLGYLGISFGGGIGALALAWERRISRGHLNIATFGHQPLRLRLASNGSAHSLQRYYLGHKKQTLRVLRFYDAAVAAKRITMPVLCACAKYDPCVAPPGQFAIYNALAGEKQLFILDAGHHVYRNQAHQEAELINALKIFFAPLSE